MDRKEEIIKILKESNQPISASTIAKQLGVSRQIIVGDVALLRASGNPIVATPRGYIVEGLPSKHYQVAVKHRRKDVKDELYTIVDLGGKILDVIVEHPIYGEIKGQLQIKSRYDVDLFVEQVTESNSAPLSQLTEGLHIHTIECDSEATFNRIKDALNTKGYLYEK